MLGNLLGGPERKLARAFEKAAKTAPPGPLAEFYAAGLPDLAQPVANAPLMAIDLETDGLDPRSDSILESGSIEIRDGLIQANSASRIRIRPGGDLKADAVVVHRITDDEAAKALPLEEAFAQILELCAGRVLVAHFAEVEAGFLDAASRKLYGAPLVAPFICTMQLEMRWVQKQRAHDGLRLGKLRSQYGLPTYRAHDGLTDAVACGELLLAQLASAAREQAPLADLLRR